MDEGDELMMEVSKLKLIYNRGLDKAVNIKIEVGLGHFK